MVKTGPAEKVAQDIRRRTRRGFSAEEKIRIVLKGLRGEESIATLVVSALLPGEGALYDPAVTVEGKILVGVENPPEGSVPDLERSLGAPPGALVRTV
jgi:hypothetical protein